MARPSLVNNMFIVVLKLNEMLTKKKTHKLCRTVITARFSIHITTFLQTFNLFMASTIFDMDQYKFIRQWFPDGEQAR